MKKQYANPELNIVLLDDVITTSGGAGGFTMSTFGTTKSSAESEELKFDTIISES